MNIKWRMASVLVLAHLLMYSGTILAETISLKSENKGSTTILKKKVSGSAFGAFAGGLVASLNGCFINRLTDFEDGNMYANLDIPTGSVITAINVHFFDMARSFDVRPALLLRKQDGNGGIETLVTVQRDFISSDFPGFYIESVDLQPDYVVQDSDFFDLIFTAAGDMTSPINAYHICGVEILYQAATLP
jgi:hypothetical protein